MEKSDFKTPVPKTFFVLVFIGLMLGTYAFFANLSQRSHVTPIEEAATPVEIKISGDSTPERMYGPFLISTQEKKKEDLKKGVVTPVVKEPIVGTSAPIVEGYWTRKEWIDQVNIQREEGSRASTATIKPLRENLLLDTAAQLKAEDMAAKRYFAHVSPFDGRDHNDFIDAVGYDRSWSGENLAWRYVTPEDTLRGWIGSPTHYANIVSPNYTETGIGVARDSDGAWYVVQLFGSQPGN